MQPPRWVSRFRGLGNKKSLGVGGSFGGTQKLAKFMSLPPPLRFSCEYDKGRHFPEDWDELFAPFRQNTFIFFMTSQNSNRPDHHLIKFQWINLTTGGEVASNWADEERSNLGLNCECPSKFDAILTSWRLTVGNHVDWNLFLFPFQDSRLLQDLTPLIWN